MLDKIWIKIGRGFRHEPKYSINNKNGYYRNGKRKAFLSRVELCQGNLKIARCDTRQCMGDSALMCKCAYVRSRLECADRCTDRRFV